MSRATEQPQDSPVTFGLVHGAWHGAWCWDKVVPLLQAAGHKAVAMDLPIEDPQATFDTYADTVAESLQSHENIILVGHSRSGNVIPRVASRIKLQGLIYLCAAVAPTKDFVSDPAVQAPLKIAPAYAANILKRSDRLTEYDASAAEKFFYHDCTPEVSAWAIGRLRPQNRSDYAPALEQQPAIPSDVILCTDDRIMDPVWLRYVSRAFLGVTPTELPGGHSPFLSRPEQLAQTLIDLAITQQAASL